MTKLFRQQIRPRLEQITSQLPSGIQIIFATKYLNKDQFISFIELASELNISPLLIGENKVQDAQEKLTYVMEKSPYLRSKFTYVLIGNLQKNKINKALKTFDEIHSIDSIELAEELNKKLISENRKVPVFLEVNVANELVKRGFKIEDIEEAIGEIQQLKNIIIQGLMTMPPYTKNPESNRPYFRKLKQIANRRQLRTSMGTSQDWKIAVEEGSNIIRVGKTIFDKP